MLKFYKLCQFLVSRYRIILASNRLTETILRFTLIWICWKSGELIPKGKRWLKGRIPVECISLFKI